MQERGSGHLRRKHKKKNLFFFHIVCLALNQLGMLAASLAAGLSPPADTEPGAECL